MTVLSNAPKDQFASPVERLLASVANLRQHPTSKGAHFFRTSLRRFQAWSNVFHPSENAEQRQTLRFLDKVRRQAGRLRDAEVHLELVKGLSGVDLKEKQELEKVLRSRSDSYEKKLRVLLRDPIVTTLWRSLRSFDRQGRSGLEDSMLSDSIPGLDQRALSGYRAFVRQHPQLSPENLHEYRLACKNFRYTAELAGDAPEVEALTETWKAVQDTIGEWHDYVVLSQLAKKVFGDANSSVYTALTNAMKAKYTEAKRVIRRAQHKLLGQPAAAPVHKPPRRAGARRVPRGVLRPSFARAG